MLPFFDTGLDWMYQDCTASQLFPLNVILLSWVTPLWVWMITQYQLVACIPAAVGWTTVFYWRALFRAASVASVQTLSWVVSEDLADRLTALPQRVVDWFHDYHWETSLFGGWHVSRLVPTWLHSPEHPMGSLLLQPLQRIVAWTALGYTRPLSVGGAREELTVAVAVLVFCFVFVSYANHAYAIYQANLARELQQAWKPPQQPASPPTWLRWWAQLKHAARTCVSWYALASYLAVVTIPVFLTVFLSFGATIALIAPVRLAELVLYSQAESAANGRCAWARGYYVVSTGTAHWLTRVLSAYSTFLWRAAFHLMTSVTHAVYTWAPEGQRPARHAPKQRHPEATVECMMLEEDKRRVQAAEYGMMTRLRARQEEDARRRHTLWQQYQQAATGVPSQ